jgi:hypothetical protein
LKTKDLIKRLTELDPTGEEECCIANEDIFSVETHPAYYDGPLEILHRSKNVRSYNIESAEMKTTGNKIVLKSLSVENAIYQNPDLKVQTDDLRLYNKIKRFKLDAEEQRSMFSKR